VVRVTSPVVSTVTARDNPLLVRLRKLQRGSTYRRGEVWLEGEHLCRSWREHGRSASQAVISDSAWAQPPLRELAHWAPRVTRVGDALFSTVSELPSPAGLGFVIETPPMPALQSAMASVVLDRVQDAGNVGSILRSAAAFGFGQVIALEGTAALWSAKVLRAGMGAHVGLHLLEGLHADALDQLGVPLLAADAHAARHLHASVLPQPCAWVFGHEGQGLDAEVASRCALSLRIAQPGGQESLNVAAAAAICLYTSRVGGA
jgi:RNA methyltransferase, TrmH family